MMPKFKVLEVNQWASTGNVEAQMLDDFDPAKVTGGDADAVRRLGIGSGRILEVDENQGPPLGHVWYRTGPDGKLVKWKTNYDSSD